MMRVYEFIAFLGIATAAHLGAWSVAPQSSGAASSGGGGQQDVTLAAATAAQAQMVSDWQRPPTPTTVIQTAMDAPDTPAALAAPSQVALTGPRLPAMPVAPTLPAAVALPKVDTLPAERPDPKRFSKRPKERPAALEKTVAAAAVATAGQKEQKARGRAKVARDDRGGKSADVSSSQAKNNALRAAWSKKIYSKIRPNMVAPAQSAASGAAKLELRVASNGRLQSVTLKRSSGDAHIDKAALRAVSRAGRFARAPKGLDGDVHRFSLSLGVTR